MEGTHESKTPVKERALQTRNHARQILETETDMNADYVYNMTRKYTTLHQYAQYWQKNNV
jgi:hypothetical protein